jgi:hypothetical protein
MLEDSTTFDAIPKEKFEEALRCGKEGRWEHNEYLEWRSTQEAVHNVVLNSFWFQFALFGDRLDIYSEFLWHCDNMRGAFWLSSCYWKTFRYRSTIYSTVTTTLQAFCRSAILRRSFPHFTCIVKYGKYI